MRRNDIVIMILACLIWLIFFSACQQKPRLIRFGGGPAGGTFYRIAVELAEIIKEGTPGTDVIVLRSGGSQANLSDIDRGKLDMALVYAGDAYLGRQGRLRPELFPLKNVRAVCRLYGAPAQLAVLKDGPYHSPVDLRGKLVPVGGLGSGAALSAERFFRALDLWEEIVPVHLGYTRAMDELDRGAVQAVWELVGLPSASFAEMSRKKPLRLLELEGAARSGGLFADYPFYTPAMIPKGTYRGQDRDVRTFQDAALWVVGSHEDEALLYRSLKQLFSPAGLSRMRQAHPAADGLTLEQGLQGVRIPMPPKVEDFWREQGNSLEGAGATDGRKGSLPQKLSM